MSRISWVLTIVALLQRCTLTTTALHQIAPHSMPIVVAEGLNLLAPSNVTFANPLQYIRKYIFCT